MKYLIMFVVLILLSIVLISSCSTPAVKVDNICTLLDDEVAWYRAVKHSEKKWGVPKSLQLAFVYQESHFASDAKPPRKRWFGIPLWRDSSAYGFGQVKDATWDWYKLKTGNNNAQRDDFEDTADFIGWYVTTHHRLLGIPKNDPYRQYLAYHEGSNGYKAKTYRDKPWLQQVARKVANNAQKFDQQLKKCHKQLESRGIWRFFR